MWELVGVVVDGKGEVIRCFMGGFCVLGENEGQRTWWLKGCFWEEGSGTGRGGWISLWVGGLLFCFESVVEVVRIGSCGERMDVKRG